jgi:hypothetical protein
MPEGNNPLGRLGCRWVDNIEIDIRGIGWGGVDWFDLAQDRNRAHLHEVSQLIMMTIFKMYLFSDKFVLYFLIF